MNAASVFVLALVVLAAALAVRSIVKSHKTGGHCASCGSAGACASCRVTAEKIAADIDKAADKEDAK